MTWDDRATPAPPLCSPDNPCAVADCKHCKAPAKSSVDTALKRATNDADLRNSVGRLLRTAHDLQGEIGTLRGIYNSASHDRETLLTLAIDLIRTAHAAHWITNGQDQREAHWQQCKDALCVHACEVILNLGKDGEP